jgi:MFS family permease
VIHQRDNYTPWRIIGADLFSDIGNRFVVLLLIDLLVFQGQNAVSSLVLMCVFEQVPAILLSPAAGWGVGRFGAKKWLILVVASKGLLVGAFLLATGRAGMLSVYFLFLVCSLFFAVGRLSLVPLIVPGARLVSFNALNERVAVAGAVAAPWLIGLALSRLHQPAVMGMAFLFFLGSVVMIRGIRVPASAARDHRMETVSVYPEKGLIGLTVSFRRLFSAVPAMGPAFLMLGFVVAGSGVLTIGLPLYFKTAIQGDIAGWGLIMSAFQAGAFVSTLLLPRLENALCQGPAAPVLFMILAAGIYLLTMAVTETQIALLMFLFGGGFTMMLIFWESLIQQCCPEEMTGRVMALLASFKGTCYLVAVSAGALVSVLWDARSFLIIGALFVAVAAFVPRKTPSPSSVPSAQPPAAR